MAAIIGPFWGLAKIVGEIVLGAVCFLAFPIVAMAIMSRIARWLGCKPLAPDDPRRKWSSSTTSTTPMVTPLSRDDLNTNPAYSYRSSNIWYRG